MKACVLYCSHTGNTKFLAEKIGTLLKTQVFDVTNLDPSAAEDFQLLIIGTPVNGLRPAPEVSSFVKRLPECKNKKTILFCTYAMRQGGTLKALEKELTKKGYSNLLGVSERVLRKSKTDFSKILAEIKQAAETCSF